MLNIELDVLRIDHRNTRVNSIEYISLRTLKKTSTTNSAHKSSVFIYVG